MTDEGHPGDGRVGRHDPDDVPPAPWSFKITVALAVLYLAWRLVQGIVWVVERLV